MSADPSDQRAILASKAKDELVQIAAAAGVKVPARARKADIVDAILGGGDQPEATAETVPAETVPADTGPAETVPSEASSAGAAEQPAATTGPTVRRVRIGPGGGAAESGDDSSGDDSSGDDSAVDDSAADDSATGEVADTTADSGAQDTEGGEGNAGAQGAKGKKGSKQRAGEAETSADTSGGGGTEGKRSGGKQSGDSASDEKKGDKGKRQDEVEPGNRRRRRRGRGGDDEQWQGEPVECDGVLDLRDEGYGFLRTRGLLPSADDVYVAAKQVRQYGLRRGDRLVGASRPASRNEKNPAMLRIDSVNGNPPEAAKDRPDFEALTPLYPDERLPMEVSWNKGNLTARVIDLVSPIGKGQRGLIVAPPKAGKTTIIKTIAKSIEENNPEVDLIMLLVDERPEEVTDIKRSVKGEVISSTFDRPADEHIQVAELTIERAKRSVESGRDVVVILDGITRLARAYNLAAPGTGRIMSGGVDSAALYPPKKFFGAARNLEEGGSLTILATALIETGSKMDEVIFEEFKGTGNMELRLDRRMAERRVFPAVDVAASSTRHEELLLTPRQVDQIWKLRRILASLDDDPAAGSGLELLVERLGTFSTNEEFLDEISKSASN